MCDVDNLFSSIFTDSTRHDRINCSLSIFRRAAPLNQEIERERVRIRLLQLEAGALEMQAVSVARAHQESRERERAMKDKLEALQQSSLQDWFYSSNRQLLWLVCFELPLTSPSV